MKQKDILSNVERISKSLKDLMGLDGVVEMEVIEDLSQEEYPRYKVNFTGEDLGFLIGPQGRHLQSIQYIMRLMLNKLLEEDQRVDILADAGGYVDDRIQRIESLAMKKADDARIMGTEVSLDPMNAFERKVVHMAISKFDDVETESQGEGYDRHVTIIPKSDEELGIGMDEDPEELEESEE
ncbi:KH domain-containing protein [Candidatus Dojkabacteria bacterium]|nr:KH domain-containing protein [Candidatus Dojkabacteria bacterium]